MKKTPGNVFRVLLIDDYQLLRHGLSALTTRSRACL